MVSVPFTSRGAPELDAPEALDALEPTEALALTEAPALALVDEDPPVPWKSNEPSACTHPVPSAPKRRN